MPNFIRITAAADDEYLLNFEQRRSHQTQHGRHQTFHLTNGKPIIAMNSGKSAFRAALVTELGYS
jgi:hypothetical protein